LQRLDAAFETQHRTFRPLVAVEAAEQEPATDLSYVALPDFLVAARAVCLGLEVGIVDQDAAEHGSRASASGGRSDNVARRANLRRRRFGGRKNQSGVTHYGLQEPPSARMIKRCIIAQVP
jgi:hypothetical protein